MTKYHMKVKSDERIIEWGKTRKNNNGQLQGEEGNSATEDNQVMYERRQVVNLLVG